MVRERHEVNSRETEDRARVRLQLESRPENVALVRSALSSLGEALSLGEQLVSDLKTAISEACNNVVLHAYEDRTGPMVITVDCSADRLDVLVRDRGEGLHRLAAAEDRMGLGLAVMSALADRVEFRSPRDGGTEVRMCFNRTEQDLDSYYLGAFADDDETPLELTGDAVLWLEPVTLLRPVLGRVLRAIAAGAHFSVERFGDLYAVVDALSDYAAQVRVHGMIGFAMKGSSRRLELVSGPIPGDTPLDSLRSTLADVVDEVSTGHSGAEDTLELVLLDRR
jgi:anti-sigma regulatory factor (Ser/Thr protein kinase)